MNLNGGGRGIDGIDEAGPELRTGGAEGIRALEDAREDVGAEGLTEAGGLNSIVRRSRPSSAPV